MEKVYISEPIDQRAVALLAQHFEVVQGDNPTQLVQQATGCAGMLVRVAKVTRQDMEALPDLKVIGKHGIGLDNIDVAAATELGIAIVNAPLSNINAVAEHAVTLMLCACKNIVPLDGYTRRGEFHQRSTYVNRELSGCTVGLFGLGKIARLVAQKLSAFGVNLLGYDPYVSAAEVKDLGIMIVTRDELLTQSDFISLHIPLTTDNHHLFGHDYFQQMKSSAYLINTARGPVVDEFALYKALSTGQIAGAALDVFDPEPPTADNPLFALPNVVVSPHNAALTDRALLAMAMDSAEGIRDWLQGQTPQYLCNNPQQTAK